MVEMLQGDNLSRRVCNIVEGMTCAQRLKFIAMSDQFLDLFNGLGLMKPGSLIRIIAGPITSIVNHIATLRCAKLISRTGTTNSCHKWRLPASAPVDNLIHSSGMPEYEHSWRCQRYLHDS